MIQFNFTNFITANVIASVLTAASSLNPINSPSQTISIPIYQESTNTYQRTQQITICEGSGCREKVDRNINPPSIFESIFHKTPSDNIFNQSAPDIFGFTPNPEPTPTFTPTPQPTPTPIPSPTPSQQNQPRIIFPTRLPFPTRPSLRMNSQTSTPSNTPNPTQIPPPQPTALPSVVNTELDAVNQYRQDHGLKSLIGTSDICKVAQIRAREANNHFSHDGFESGVSDLDYSRAAENLWQGQPFTYERMVQAWHDSSGHRQNMQGDYTHGCGARSGNTAAFIFIKR